MQAARVISLLLGLLVLNSGLAETIYKCQLGEKTIYSQEPCAKTGSEIKTLELNDARSAEQREQALAAAQAQAKAAEALESKRLAKEAKEAKEAKFLADQQAATARATPMTKSSEPVAVQPIIVVRPTSRAVPPPPTPPKPYCHLSALRCN